MFKLCLPNYSYLLCYWSAIIITNQWLVLTSYSRIRREESLMNAPFAIAAAELFTDRMVFNSIKPVNNYCLWQPMYCNYITMHTTRDITIKVNLTILHLVSVHLKCRHFSEKTAHQSAAPDNHTRHEHEAKLHNKITCNSFQQKRSSTFKHMSNNM